MTAKSRNVNCFKQTSRLSVETFYFALGVERKSVRHLSLKCEKVINFAFDRTHTIYVVIQSRGFHDVPRALMRDALSFQFLDSLTHFASISCWYRSGARQDEFSCFVVNFKSTRL